MSLKFWLKKPLAFAEVWQERGFRRAVYASLRYVFWPGRHIQAQRRYEHWFAAQQLSAEAVQQVRAEVNTWEQAPTFSVLVPVYNIQPSLLIQAIESVRSQAYPHWQLILADDCSPSPETRAALEQYVGVDERIQVLFLPQNGGISAATNAALEQATGDYIALLDHDDEMTMGALYENAKVICQQPDVDILYSDEDKITPKGQYTAPFFKPDWSPDYFHGCMYTCHLGVYRTALVCNIGGFRSAYDGAQDWDLMLRLSEKTQRIHHIPKILYHWRITATSVTSGAEVKPWAYEAAQRALTDMTLRSPYPGKAEETSQIGFYRVRRQLVEHPLVSIVIPSAGTPMADGRRSHLENCLASIVKKSTYPHIELVVVDGYDIPPDTLNKVKDVGVELVRCDEPFNFSRRINAGVAHSRGEIVLLLNDDIEVMTPDWIEAMLELAQQPEIGAVGAKLYFPNNRIQHAGVIILDGRPGHAFYELESDDRGYYCATVVNRNYLCVTGACLMLRRSAFDEVNGLDDIFPLSYNDVDFCLKLHEAGYRNVCTPFAQLIHHGSASRDAAVMPEELATFQHRWQDYLHSLGGDPYYNRNLDQTHASFLFKG
ncbi:MAG: glycosyltransferase [Cyanobacteria bacterium P01_F01_bin.56]